MGEEVEVRAIGDPLINPEHSLDAQISDVMLELFAIPLLLLRQQFGREKPKSPSLEYYLYNRRCTWLRARAIKRDWNSAPEGLCIRIRHRG